VVERLARTEHEARQRYVDFLSLPLDCITNAQWALVPPLVGPTASWTLSLTRSGDPVRLRRDDGTAVYFRALQRFEPRQIDLTNWRMHTLEYKYEVWEPQPDRTNKPVIEWHWHPNPVTSENMDYHVHVRATEAICGVASRRLHIPSERVAFESVVRFIMKDLHVRPRHDDWERRVDDALAAFQKYRTDRAPPN
jgi:hypothetical protein